LILAYSLKHKQFLIVLLELKKIDFSLSTSCFGICLYRLIFELQ